MNTARLLSLCLGFLTVLRLHAQTAGSMDTNFVAVAGTDAVPLRFAPLPDGRLYVGGPFTNYGGAGKAGVARLQASGQVDAAFTLAPLRQISPAVIFNGQVLVPASTNAGQLNALLALPDGRLVVSGVFTHIGAVAANGLAIVALDGTPAVTSFSLGDLQPQSGALMAGPAGTFYVGNKGNLASGRLPLLRFKYDGSPDATFSAPTLAALGYQTANPFTVLPGPGGSLYVITAAAVNSAPASDILRLTSAGALDTAFAGTGQANIPYANQSSFVTDASGRLTFANVTTYRGAALSRKINRLNLDGTLDATFQPTVSLSAGGRLVGAQADGKILFMGGTAPINRLNNDGSLDTGYADPGKVPVKQTFLSLTSFAMAPDGSVFAGGFTFSSTFQIMNGAYHIFGDPNSGPTVSVEPVAQTNTLGGRTRFTVTAQGAAPLSYQWYRGSAPIGGATLPDLILPATVAGDDADYHCVVSNSLGSVTSATVHLTLLAATAGSVHRETDVPAGPNGSVAELTWDANGGLLAAGGFSTWNNTNRNMLVRLLPGSADVDPAFVPLGSLVSSGHPFNEVLSLPGGRVFASGQADFQIGAQRYGGVRFNSDGSLDPAFLAQVGASSMAAEVLAAQPTVGPDGKVVLWASYWNDENVGGSFIRLNPNGTRDTGFALRGSGYGLNGYAVTALPDGRYLAAGRMSSAVPANGVVRLNANGTVDPTFVSNFDNRSLFTAAGDVNQIRVLADGKILLAGVFKYRANTPSPDVFLGMIRLLPNGTLDPTFNPVPALSHSESFLLGGLRRFDLQADGRIVGLSYGGGTFPRSHLLRFWPNGTRDPEFDVPTNSVRNANNGVTAVAVRTADNAIFVGGTFREFSQLPRTNFARINGGPLRPTPAPPTIAIQPTRVMAKAGTGVALTVVPGGDGPFQFQWRRSSSHGSADLVDIPGANESAYILASPGLLPQDSGLFQCVVVNPGGAVASTLITVLVEPDPPVPGTRDTSFVGQDFHGILTGQPQVTDPAPGGLLYGSLGTTVVRLREDGTRDGSFNPPADLVPSGGGIAVVKRQPDGKLLIAGRLKDGAVARLLPDGSYDPGFVRTLNYTGGFQNVPSDIGLQSDGRILLAGTFDNFAGQPVTGLLRLLPDGTVDPAFPLTGIENLQSNPARVLPGTVVSLRVLPDDRIYIGGGFNRVRGATRHGVARLNADGSLDSGFVPPTNGAVASGTSGSMLFYALGPVTSANGVYVFGTFRPDINAAADSALRLRPDGSIDGSFHVTTDFQINFGAVQADGKLIVTGQFTRLNGQPRGGFARLNGNGSTDASFTQGATFGVGSPMAILPDGKLLIGGTRYFTGGDVEVAAPEVAFTLIPGGLELTWPAGFQLQRATTLSPPDWRNVANPSPFTVPFSGLGEFFRVVPAP